MDNTTTWSTTFRWSRSSSTRTKGRNAVGIFTPEDVDLISNLASKVGQAGETLEKQRRRSPNVDARRDGLIDSDALAPPTARGFSNIDALRRMQMRNSSEENLNRTNYRRQQHRLPGGDWNSSFDFGAQSAEEDQLKDKRVYNWPHISNRSRVYKGGGWDDRAYYSFLAPDGTWMSARVLRPSASDARMDRVGTPSIQRTMGRFPKHRQQLEELEPCGVAGGFLCVEHKPMFTSH